MTETKEFSSHTNARSSAFGLLGLKSPTDKLITARVPDRTKNTTVERNLRPAESQAHLLASWFNESSDLFLALDIDGRILTANTASLQLLSKDFAGVRGQLWHDLGRDAEKQYAKRALEMAICSDASSYFQQRIAYDEGSHYWIDWSIVFKQGIFILIGRESTSAMQAQAELKLADRVMQDCREGIVIINAFRKIVRINRAFTLLTGFSHEEILNKSLHTISAARMESSKYRHIWRAVKETGGWQGEVTGLRKSGEEFPQWLSMSMIDKRDTGECYYVAIFSDISERKRTEERIYRLAHYDSVTGLANRVLFRDRLEIEMNKAKRSGSSMAVIFLDLDRFKAINDSLGHAVGDLLLKEVAKRLSASVRQEDTVARLGGDEFTVILSGLGVGETPGRSAAIVAQKILKSLSEPVDLDGHQTVVSASLGISVYPLDNDASENEPDELIKNADAAMYHAKSQGRNNYQFYSADMNASAHQRLNLENRLRSAIEKEELELYYQPQVDLRDGSVIGVEALLRWNHPDCGVLSPLHFIQLAEDTGLIIPLGEWILEKACQQYRQWLDSGLQVKKLAVNLSARQFNQAGLVSFVAKLIRNYNLPAGTLELEIVENTLLDSSSKSSLTLCELSEMGVRLAVDDFGTGYSSLSYLKRFPFNILKIDKSFIRDVTQNSNNQAIVRAMIAMASSLGLEVVAEGIETEEQIAFLNSEQCVVGQGYLFARPLPVSQVTQLLRTGNMLNVA